MLFNIYETGFLLFHLRDSFLKDIHKVISINFSGENMTDNKGKVAIVGGGLVYFI